MTQQVFSTVENNFTKGLITESTGLNFPENAATNTDNCIYTLVGDVTRRLGINYEDNAALNNVPNSGEAYTTYKWDNAGGDGLSQIVVVQIGNNLYFYRSSATTSATSLSSQLLSSTVVLTQYAIPGSTFDSSLECQYADGNGYLFIFHPSINPLYCVYNPTSTAVTSFTIPINIRDFAGLSEPGVLDTTRTTTLSNTHNYNLVNQGWSGQPTWNFTSHSNLSLVVGGGVSFTDAPAGLTIHPGDPFIFSGGISTTTGVYIYNCSAIVSSYSGTTLIGTLSSVNGPTFSGAILSETWYLMSGASNNFISSWNGIVHNYPSNADVWWIFKNTSGVFDPATTVANRFLSSPAPKGSVLLDLFNQDRSALTAIPGISVISTFVRPKTGTWFQGRVWYSGIDASVNNSINNPSYYTWTENIYFSQVIENVSQFGKCYQLNDPTSETLFDLLPTDGGVITIPGCGSIYKLFPVQNGLIVFAANGVWFITGSQGIGFTANDYTIVKLSQVKSISGGTFVNVLGLPYFWNEEGIYEVSASQNGSLTVNPITIGTILDFYNKIPTNNRKYAKGVYDPINYVITWVYKSVSESSISDRYNFNRALNFNTYNKAFYPYTVSGSPHINSIVYIASPGGSSAPDPIVKYLVQDITQNFTFAEENDETYVDFRGFDAVGADFSSFFVTGYKLRGQAIRKFQPTYINVYTRTNGAVSAYKFQGIWDFSNNINSNRWSTVQLTYVTDTNYDTIPRRHKLRGHGYSLQFKVASVTGQPFDIQGWAVVDTVNASV